jgi:hypothetical protein
MAQVIECLPSKHKGLRGEEKEGWERKGNRSINSKSNYYYLLNVFEAYPISFNLHNHSVR